VADEPTLLAVRPERTSRCHFADELELTGS
jgi:hypothetical protein